MRPKNAFSLIEAAIVLAVLALVMGGIWAAAAAVSFNRKANDLQEGILMAYANLSNFKADGVNSWCATGEMNIFPSHWTSSGSWFYAPFNVGLAACMGTDGMKQFMLYPDVSDLDTVLKMCGRVLPALFKAGGNNIRNVIFTFDDAFLSYAPPNLPATATEAMYNCNSSDLAGITITFK